MSKLSPAKHSAASSWSTRLGKSSKQVQVGSMSVDSKLDPVVLIHNGVCIKLYPNGTVVSEPLSPEALHQHAQSDMVGAGFASIIYPDIGLNEPTGVLGGRTVEHAHQSLAGLELFFGAGLARANPEALKERVSAARKLVDINAAFSAHLNPTNTPVRARTRDRQGVPLDVLTQQLIDKADVRRLDERREAMRASAVQAILQNSEWVTASQLSDIINPALRNKHAKASSFLKDKRVFALLKDGENIYPRYQFDATGQPIPVVAEILKVFDGYTGFRVAAWFESTSSALNGKRPREVLETMSREVLAAAVAHERGPMHG